MVILTLAGYSLTNGLAGLMALRVFHGLAFVVMGSALTALIMPHIPSNGSARFFGIISIVILIPNSLVPPLLPFLTRAANGLPGVLMGFAALTGLVFFLLPLIPDQDRAAGCPKQGLALTRAEIREDLTDHRVLTLLLAMLCLYCGHALVFFFLDGFSNGAGITHAGFFLTLSTMGEIGVRLLGGKKMDRSHKGRLLIGTLACLALGYLMLGSLTCLPRRLKYRSSSG